MKSTINYRIGLLVIFLVIGMFSTIEAAHFKEKVTATSETQTIFKGKNTKVKTYLKAKVSKFKNRMAKDETITKGAKIALVAGLFSLAFLIIPFVIGYAFGLLALAAVLAIIGDVFAIITFKKIRESENPKDYKTERTVATWGLVLSLLTGLIPLFFLVAVLVSL